MSSNKGYYITNKGERVELELVSQYALHLNDKDIVELVLPLGVKEVYCFNNKLKELVLPKSVIFIYCDPIKIINKSGNNKCRVGIFM